MTYWYLRHLSDQVNVWNNAAVRWMRRTERRLCALEAAQSSWMSNPGDIPGRASSDVDIPGRAPPSDDLWAEVIMVADVEESVAEMVASAIAEVSGMVAVLGCGGGVVLEKTRSGRGVCLRCGSRPSSYRRRG